MNSRWNTEVWSNISDLTEAEMIYAAWRDSCTLKFIDDLSLSTNQQFGLDLMLITILGCSSH